MAESVDPTPVRVEGEKEMSEIAYLVKHLDDVALVGMDARAEAYGWRRDEIRAELERRGLDGRVR